MTTGITLPMSFGPLAPVLRDHLAHLDNLVARELLWEVGWRIASSASSLSTRSWRAAFRNSSMLSRRLFASFESTASASSSLSSLRSGDLGVVERREREAQHIATARSR